MPRSRLQKATPATPEYRYTPQVREVGPLWEWRVVIELKRGDGVWCTGGVLEEGSKLLQNEAAIEAKDRATYLAERDKRPSIPWEPA